MHASHPTPQYKRILVPTDGSDSARGAAETAAQLALISGGRVLALRVLPPETGDAESMGMSGMAGLTPLEAALIDTPPRGLDDAGLAAIEGVVRGHGVPVESQLVFNSTPARAIADAAENSHCDLIVMASGEYGNVMSLISGSTTAKVASECAVPVLVVQ
jgi:nucleotide-binding universal stress UspA family protein